jgi:hypothetical protein
MDKKDYELIAEVMSSSKPNEDSNAYEDERMLWEDTVVEFARALHEKNPKFDEGRFIEACNK